MSLEQLHEGCLQFKKQKKNPLTQKPHPLKQPGKNAQDYSSQQHLLNVVSEYSLSWAQFDLGPASKEVALLTSNFLEGS